MNIVPQKSAIRHSDNDQMTSRRNSWVQEFDRFHQVVRHDLRNNSRTEKGWVELLLEERRMRKISMKVLARVGCLPWLMTCRGECFCANCRRHYRSSRKRRWEDYQWKNYGATGACLSECRSNWPHWRQGSVIGYQDAFTRYYWSHSPLDDGQIEGHIWWAISNQPGINDCHIAHTKILHRL